MLLSRNLIINYETLRGSNLHFINDIYKYKYDTYKFYDIFKIIFYNNYIAFKHNSIISIFNPFKSNKQTRSKVNFTKIDGSLSSTRNL